MILYRIYVGLEDNQKRQYTIKEFRNIVDKYLKEYTLIPSYGIWEGKHEPSIIIEKISHFPSSTFTQLIVQLKRKLNQEVIILTEQPLKEVYYV